MEELASSNVSLDNENKERHKPADEETLKEDEFDLAYKMIFKDTLRLRSDQVWRWCKSFGQRTGESIFR